MTTVTFVSADGERRQAVDVADGSNLLDIAQAQGQPLEGTCEGQMACSTCHVIIAGEDFQKFPPASENEEDLLDLAAHVKRTSRLACQLTITDAMESLIVHMPAEAHNMQGR